MSTASLVHVNNRAASGWFWTLTAMIFVMAVVGAITRLTESGLSIMEWAPIAGSLPPLNGAEWDRLFALYQQTDEYRLQWQADMSMADFQSIFWWEWIHRLWGRLIGLVALAGFVWGIVAAVRGRVGWGMPLHLFLIGLGVAMQGALGWFMVHSGFMAGLTDVDSVRLAMHLSAALLLFTYTLIMALGTRLQWRAQAEIVSAGTLSLLRLLATGMVILLAVTIVSGALVAGNNAGEGYNSWPLMNGELVPTAYDSGMATFDNWTKNNAAIQFNHRTMATVTMLFAVAMTVIALMRIGRTLRIRRAVHSVGGWVVVQYALGVATILMSARGVPIGMGALHQAGALVLLGLTVGFAMRCLQPNRVAMKQHDQRIGYHF